MQQATTSMLKLFMFKMLVVCLSLSTGSAVVRAQRYQDFTTRTPLQEGHLLIIGFMGGREPWDNAKRGVRKLALKLRAQNLPAVHVETVENKKRGVAEELIRKAFDRNQDGRLDQQERASAQVILYGQSFGGAAVVKLARQLQRMDVPVLLTVQVDSVGRSDKWIPANVARAANLFQQNGRIIRGERQIRAEDPRRTEIIGNFEFDYRKKRIDLAEVSWLKKLFQAAHTKMDHDPEVWALIEKIISDVIHARSRVLMSAGCYSQASYRRRGHPHGERNTFETDQPDYRLNCTAAARGDVYFNVVK